MGPLNHIKTNALGQIKWEQIMFFGNPEYVCDLQPIDFAAVAPAFGIAAFSVDDPAKCGAVLKQALDVPGPARRAIQHMRQIPLGCFGSSSAPSELFSSI